MCISFCEGKPGKTSRVDFSFELSMSKKINAHGFTIIEIMIVVAIIAVLTAIAIPKFAAYRQKAYNAAALSDLQTTKNIVETYFHEHTNYPY
jgi:type IV pilus assembly protein PilA